MFFYLDPSISAFCYTIFVKPDIMSLIFLVFDTIGTMQVYKNKFVKTGQNIRFSEIFQISAVAKYFQYIRFLAILQISAVAKSFQYLSGEYVHV